MAAKRMPLPMKNRWSTNPYIKQPFANNPSPSDPVGRWEPPLRSRHELVDALPNYDTKPILVCKVKKVTLDMMSGSVQ